MNKKILAIILIAVAVISIVLGVVTFIKADIDWSSGIYTSKKTYGGDAYTGIQNAAADTSFNVTQTNAILKDMNKTIAIGLGSILIVLGLVVAAVGVAFLLGKKEKSAPAAPVVEPAFVPSDTDPSKSE